MNICEINSYRWDECFRNVLSLVTELSVKKLLISGTFSPLILLIVQIIKYHTEGRMKISLDREWTTLLTYHFSYSISFVKSFILSISYVEFIIILGFVCPLVVPLSLFAIYSHYMFMINIGAYHIKLDNNTLEFYEPSFSTSYSLLYLSIILNQIIFLGFIWANIKNTTCFIFIR